LLNLSLNLGLFHVYGFVIGIFLAILEDWTRDLVYGRGAGSEGGTDGGVPNISKAVRGSARSIGSGIDLRSWTTISTRRFFARFSGVRLSVSERESA
jgi:hypothetical protein